MSNCSFSAGFADTELESIVRKIKTAPKEKKKDEKEEEEEVEEEEDDDDDDDEGVEERDG